MSTAYLEKLNPEQRRAVEHGVQDSKCVLAAPLLVIAGAGSGKTNTLAHRVAHLIVNGADPHRILLMTFSRRAAAEMSRRVERICRQVIGANTEMRKVLMSRPEERDQREEAFRRARVATEMKAGLESLIETHEADARLKERRERHRRI
jgi:superfamily I DNA/RNA helicase